MTQWGQSLFARMKPTQAAPKPRTTLEPMYNKLIAAAPVRNVVKASHSKLENVVYPPKMPVTRKSRQFAFSAERFRNKVIRTPIKNEPVMLMRNVPAGNAPE